ncbi:MAG: YlxR family protein [Chloroflexi bacterium]|nr:YlxR family protein [Chloroflexota bacterium]
MGQKKRKQPKRMPQRTCIVCRQKNDKRQLTRIVRTQDAEVIVDPTGKRNGRGAYLCQQPACWDKITSSARLLNQALITEVTETELTAIAAHKPIAAQSEAETAQNNWHP